MASRAAASLSPNLARRLMVRLLPLLVLLYVLKEIDRSNVGFAALFMNRALGFSPTVYGTGAGTYFIGYVLLNIPANVLAYRIGARKAIAWMMLAWGFIAMAMAFVWNAPSFYTLRFLLGVAEAGFMPSVLLYVSAWFPQRERATAIAWLSTAASLQVVVSGPLSGAILEMPPVFGLAPWQLLFVIEALPTIVLALFVRAYLSDAPQNAAWLGAAERAEIEEALRRDAAERPVLSGSKGVDALRNWRVWVAGAINLFIGSTFLTMVLWMPQIVRHLQNVRPLYIGLITATPFLLSIVTLVLFGWLSDRTGLRFPFVAGGMLVGAVCLAASAYLSNAPVVALVLLIAGLVVFLPVISPFWSFVSEFLEGEARAVGMAFVVATGSIGGFIVNYLLGWFRQHFGNFQAGLYAISLIMLCGALIMCLFGAYQELAARPAPRPGGTGLLA
jgi:MFS transporter, ACS family, tartrate transporter